MSLFLTSDENVYGNDNTRTAFDNCIDQDFFARDGKKYSIKRDFFDAKFQTLFSASLSLHYKEDHTDIIRGHQMFDWDQQQKNSWSKSFLP